MSKIAQVPYQDYKLYIVFHQNENRRMANLVKLGSKSKIRTTMSYARYLMSVHLGRVLDKCEHVDHINGNKLDDRVDNFQIISQAENSKKYRTLDNPVTLLDLICPVCGVEFRLTKQRAYSVIHLGKQKCCSKKCGYKMSNIKGWK